jgi:hypothetical protein
MPGFVVDPTAISSDLIGTFNFKPTSGVQYYALTRNNSPKPLGSGYNVFHTWQQANLTAQAYNTGALDSSNNSYGVVAETLS